MKKLSGGKSQSLRDCVHAALDQYFADLKGHAAENVYPMVIHEVEKAILESVMAQAEGNQTHAAEMLGINRSTLRKKLKLHELEP
jgi:Fis family transcriptional regulator